MADDHGLGLPWWLGVAFVTVMAAVLLWFRFWGPWSRLGG
jgi:hypothetical protein